MVRKLPDTLLRSLEGIPGFDRTAFEDIHTGGDQVTSVRINPLKLSSLPEDHFFQLSERVPWATSGYYLDARPSFTFDPLFHAGCYYVQEASSMFVEQAFRQLCHPDASLKVLDLAAAPGGKTTHILSLLSPGSLLVSNEVIKSRCHILVDNVVKWGSANQVVTMNDPSAFNKTPGYFDVIVVDAPCSGSGLFRRDNMAISEWSVHNVQLCSQRQQRILSDVLPALKEDGILIYSTCSFSQEENEDMGDWLSGAFDLKNERLDIDQFPGITETRSPVSGTYGYRFYPYLLKGEGFFLSCFRKTTGTDTRKPKTQRAEKVTGADKEIIEDWMDITDKTIIRYRNGWHVLPDSLTDDFMYISANLNVQYAGVRAGEIMKNKLVPDHALAMSNLLKNDVPSLALPYEQAIKYLQRKELDVTPEKKGWQLAQYAGYNLGWLNALPNRMNNYYPKELRILKQHNDSTRDK